MIWIIGEYAERIDNADELLESFLESFPEEPAQVQLQLLTATVKLFLKKPTEGPQQMIQVCFSIILITLNYPAFYFPVPTLKLLLKGSCPPYISQERVREFHVYTATLDYNKLGIYSKRSSKF